MDNKKYTKEEIRNICLNECGCCTEDENGKIECLNTLGCWKDILDNGSVNIDLDY